MEDFTREEKMQQAMRLRQSRQIRMLSLEEFSELIGMSPSGYQKVESGRNSISRKLLKNIWERFKISSDYILFGEQDNLEEILAATQQCGDEEKMKLFLKLHQYFIQKK